MLGLVAHEVEPAPRTRPRASPRPRLAAICGIVGAVSSRRRSHSSPMAHLALVALLLACTRTPEPAAPPASPASPQAPAAPAPEPDPEPALAMPDTVTSVEVDGLDALPHRPLLVLTEENPYLMVDGSDVPRLVAYDDGLVVFDGGQRSVQLTPLHVRSFVETIATPEFLALPVLTRVRERGGLPTVHIGLRLGARWKYAAVYGIPLGILVLREGEAAPQGPAGFMRAYADLLAFAAPEAAPWTPESIEVMLWDFSHAGDERPWPADVPAPPSDWKDPPVGSIRRHVLAGSHEPALLRFLDGLAETQAVAFNGHRWSIAVRRVVPGERYIRAVQACVIKQTLADPPIPVGPECHVHRAPAP